MSQIEKGGSGENFDPNDLFARDRQIKSDILTTMLKKIENGIDLSKSDMRTLCGLDDHITSVENNPLTKVILSQIDINKSLASVLECDENQIANSAKKVNENTRVYFGEIDNDNVNIFEKIKPPFVIFGDVLLCESDLKTFPGGIDFEGKVSFSRCKKLHSIPKDTVFNGLWVNFSGCNRLNFIGDNVVVKGKIIVNDATNMCVCSFKKSNECSI